MPKIVMDDGQTFEVGRFAGYRGNASERNGEPFCTITLDFEVSGRQLGEYTQQLHAQITAGWDAQKAVREASGKLDKLLVEEKAALAR